MVKTDEKPNLTIKCNTPRVLEDLLNDISSKVDVIFDSIGNSSSDDEEDGDYDNEYLEVKTGSGDNAEYRHPSKSKRLRKAVRKTLVPHNHINAAIEELLNRAKRIENASLVLLDSENTILEKISEGSKRTSDCKVEEHLHHYSNEFVRNSNRILDSYFREQRSHIESIFGRLNRKCYDLKPTIDVSKSSTEISKPILSPDLAKNLYPEVTTSISTTSSSNTEPSTITRPTFNSNSYRPTWKPIINQNKSSCEDLDRDDVSGVYIFENNLAGRNSELFFNKRYCEIRGDGMWTVIQRRDNYTPSTISTLHGRTINMGSEIYTEIFWMGNDFLYKASTTRELVLRIELEDFENNAVWAEYSIFVVSPESDNYRLTVGGYTGNASDSFSGHNGSFFSTYDKTNDFAPECCPCSVSYGGGWWFNRCFESNLNGIYYKRPHDNNYFRGIIWEHWLGNYSLKKSVMMIKSKARGYYGHPTPPENSNTDTIPYYEDP
ncbi:hypothetical protein NQ318_021472 [Aromia moschata]|uniref:Fibrinogen C-terminal domain-containing protein n=1 Tax=Aromia moschata TaxID=1265417 RepID=A0AAV8ZER5_9CUCU|nr:hypothetical protein NQ318_021472 [Aromia moschata]